MKKAMLIMLFVLTINGISHATINIDWVTVGNAGNANDDTGWGGVSYVYKIGKYEVTAGQYCEFLNNVAATDAHELYNADMWSSSYGCKIQQKGKNLSYCGQIFLRAILEEWIFLEPT